MLHFQGELLVCSFTICMLGQIQSNRDLVIDLIDLLIDFNGISTDLQLC